MQQIHRLEAQNKTEICEHERKTSREERRRTIVRWRKYGKAESNKIH